MPPSQLARWSALALLVLGAVILYFLDGRRMTPLAPPAAAIDSAAMR